MGAVITVDPCQKDVCSHTPFWEYYIQNTASGFTHSQEKCARPCNEIFGSVITVDPCQKVIRYADTRPSEVAVLITLHHADTHYQGSGIDPAME